MSITQAIDEKKIVECLRNPETASEAFSKLMHLYGEQIYWHIRKMVVSHEDASDLLQNTFMKAWSNLDYFRGDAKFSTWLYKIAINESINFLNKERHRNNLSSDDNDLFLLNNIEADEYFDGDELKIRLHKAIARLPEKQRLVFNMRYFEDMKYEQMSEILGTSVGALKASYHHAVKKISEEFSES